MKYIIIIIAIAFLGQLKAQTTISGGNVSGTWKKTGSPYKINGNITIPNDSTLTIEPGVTLQFAQRKYMKVEGRILAIGKAKNTDSIWFTRQNTNDSGFWKGVKFINTTNNNDTSIFKHCVFKHCKNLFDTSLAFRGGGLAVIKYGKVKISYSSFYSNEANIGASVYITTNAFANIKSCTFKNNKCSRFYWNDNLGPTAYRERGSGISVEYNSNALIDSCVFKNNVRGKDYGSNPSVLYDASFLSVLGSTFYKQNCYATITNCTFDGNEGYGIYADNRSFVNINKCNFINSPSDIWARLVFSRYLSDVKVSNCSFTNNKPYTIVASEGSKLSVENSLFKNNEGWVSIYGDDPSGKPPTLILKNCIITNNTIGRVISEPISGIRASELYNCLVANNTFDILSCQIVYNSTIVNNAFKKGGIGDESGYYSNNYNVNFSSIYHGNVLDKYPGKQLFVYTSTSALFHNCLIENDTNTFINKYYGKPTKTPTNYKNNISSNPEFVNPTNGVGHTFDASAADFRLKSSCSVQSPAINAGIQDSLFLSMYNKDLDGNHRIFEKRVDIGAYENTSGAPIINVLNQPQKDSLCFGIRAAKLSVSAIGKGLSHQWQKSMDGGNSWSNINGQTNASLVINKSLPSENTYLYRTLLSGTCDKDTSLSQSIVTFELPVVNLGADTGICTNNSLTKLSNTSGTYLWHTGNTTNSLTQNITKDSIWWLQITNQKGCKNRDSIRVTNNELPLVYLGEDFNMYKDKEVTLDAGAGANDYLWNNGLKTQKRTFKGQDLGPSGNYVLWAEATNNKGCSARDSITVTVQGFSSIEPLHNGQVLIYPQPAQDVLNIELTDIVLNKNANLTINNIEGKEIKTIQLTELISTISVENLKSGIYLINLNLGNQILVFKWVKR